MSLSYFVNGRAIKRGVKGRNHRLNRVYNLWPELIFQCVSLIQAAIKLERGRGIFLLQKKLMAGQLGLLELSVNRCF